MLARFESLKKAFMVSLMALVAAMSMTIAGGLAGGIGEAQAAVPADVVARPAMGSAITLHYPARFAPAAKRLELQAAGSAESLRRRLGLEQFPDVQVWLVQDLDDYFRWHELKGRAPEWAVGLSLSHRRTVLLKMAPGPDGQSMEVHLQKTFDHELAHVALDIASGGHHVPRWFHEGFALHHAKEWSPERADLVARAGATSTLVPFEKLTYTFPSHHNGASLAYAQSQHFVRTIVREHGEKTLAEAMRRVRTGMPMSLAIESVTGKDFVELERAWRKRLNENTTSASMFVNGEYLFFGVALLFGVAWVRRRRRTKLVWERLDVGVEGWDYDPSRYPLPGHRADGTPAWHR